MAPKIKRVDADAFEPESNEHTIFPPDHVGNPTEERTCQAIENAVDRCRERYGRHGHRQKGDRDAVDLPVFLTLACESWDRATQPREAIAEHGLTYEDRLNRAGI